MSRRSDIGRSLSLVGSCLFLVIAAAAIYSKYGEDASTTRQVVLIILAAVSAFLVPVGRWVRAAKGRGAMSSRRSHPVKATSPHAVKEREKGLLAS
jgi:uncharacterized membrane protein